MNKRLLYAKTITKSLFTVFENHRKSLFQYCERSELRLHFQWRKVHQKCAKNYQFGEFLKTWSLRSNSVTRQITFNRTKISRNATFSSNMNHMLWTVLFWNLYLVDSNSAIFGDFQSKTESIRKCEIFSTFYFRYHFAELIVIKPFWQSASGARTFP